MTANAKKTVPAETAAAATYEPTPRERTAMDAFRARQDRRSPSPRVKVNKADDVPELRLDHPDQQVAWRLLMEALGTTQTDFLDALLSQLVNAGSPGREVDEKGLNFMLSVIKGVEPRDQTEAMLATQLAAVHMATMTFARRLAHVETIPQQDSAERAFNKLARTFALQMETLKRYRSNGEQRIVIERVSVGGNAQAIIGAVAGGGSGKT